MYEKIKNFNIKIDKITNFYTISHIIVDIYCVIW
nr:MAG TPA: hypothetical protein [Caudoviricetes sp.]